MNVRGSISTAYSDIERVFEAKSLESSRYRDTLQLLNKKKMVYRVVHYRISFMSSFLFKIGTLWSS